METCENKFQDGCVVLSQGYNKGGIYSAFSLSSWLLWYNLSKPGINDFFSRLRSYAEANFILVQTEMITVVW